MGNLQGEDDQFAVVQLAQNPIVADAVPPDPGLVSHETLSVRARIFAAVDVLPEPSDYQPTRLLIELLKLLNGLIA